MQPRRPNSEWNTDLKVTQVLGICLRCGDAVLQSRGRDPLSDNPHQLRAQVCRCVMGAVGRCAASFLRSITCASAERAYTCACALQCRDVANTGVLTSTMKHCEAPVKVMWLSGSSSAKGIAGNPAPPARSRTLYFPASRTMLASRKTSSSAVAKQRTWTGLRLDVVRRALSGAKPWGAPSAVWALAAWCRLTAATMRSVPAPNTRSVASLRHHIASVSAAKV